jgi:hypothetical protein
MANLSKTTGWPRPLPREVFLQDGRRIITLADARQVILDLPTRRQETQAWLEAGRLLLAASHRVASRVDLEACEQQLMIALKAEGLHPRN